jgi:teichuronic acid biosynthesis glycosyltransferase TuaG
VADLVSIVTPMYNSGQFIAETIESVLSQTYPHWELIIVDDASTDDSADVARRYSSLDDRIRVEVLPRNGGAAVARNAAIEDACGRYIAFLDSDDLWHPLKLEKQIPFMDRNAYGLTYTGFERIAVDGRRTGEAAIVPASITYEQLLRKSNIGCLTAAYDARRLGKIYMPNLRSRQDYGLWLRILKQEKRAYGLLEPLAWYRVRDRSVSSNKLKLLWYHWKLYTREEKLGLCRSALLVGNYAMNAVRENRRIRSSAKVARV